MSQYPANIDLSSLDGANGFMLSGEASGDGAGDSVASAGDVNGDGFDDVVVGAQGAGPHGNYSGASYVVFGRASGMPANLDLSSLNGTNGFKLSGVAAYDDTGNSVASAGDVNGDGFDDVIIGAYVADPHGANSGAAYVVFGKAGGFAANLDLSTLNGTNGFRLSGVTGSDFAGWSVHSAGDVNGDGLDDMIIGAKNAGPHGTYSGASYVVFGKGAGFGANLDLSSLDGATGFKLSGVAAADKSGVSVSSAGDINGDGFADLIVGAYGSDPHGNYSGASYVVFGKAAGFTANLDLSSLNGTNGFRISGVAADDNSGKSVAAAGDVNGDGFGDLIVAAADADPHGLSSGASYVVFGKASGFTANFDLSSLNGTNGFEISGVATGDKSGWSVASAGDVNGDGFDDLIIGAVFAGPHGNFSGASYVVFGKAAGFAANIDLSSLDGTNGFMISGVATFDESGGSVAGAGDVNGDGLADLIVGATGADPHGGTSGAAYLIYGRLPDAAVTRVGTTASQTLVGGNFADVLTGGGGNDHVFGHGGNDLMSGGSGNDIFDGGPGTDAVSYQNAAAGVHVSLLTSAAQNTIGAGTDTLIAVEKLVGSGFADTLIANATGATLNGGPGGDDLFSGPGSDILNGGGASDFADYALATSAVTVSLAVTTFQDTTGAGHDQLVGIEKLVGSGFNDLLVGDANANAIYGLAGADKLTGGAGQDSLGGGAGNDTFIFIAASDTTVAAPDTILDFQTGDKIDLHLIDADTGTAGDQAFHVGATGGHTGDIVVGAFSGGHTILTLFVNADATPDAEIILNGDHHGLAASDFVL